MRGQNAAVVTLVLATCVLGGRLSAQETIGGGDALAPGELTTVPTIQCVGLQWTVQGDLNGNAPCSSRRRLPQHSEGVPVGEARLERARHPGAHRRFPSGAGLEVKGNQGEKSGPWGC
jgi:hypothetical protein